MNLVSQAAVFAVNAHDGMLRKGTKIPYIVHPMEVAAIAASLTDDPEVIAASLLHDVMEDCGVTQNSFLSSLVNALQTLSLMKVRWRKEIPVKPGRRASRRLLIGLFAGTVTRRLSPLQIS